MIGDPFSGEVSGRSTIHVDVSADVSVVGPSGGLPHGKAGRRCDGVESDVYKRSDSGSGSSNGGLGSDLTTSAT